VGCGNLELEVPAEPDIVLCGACAAFNYDRRQNRIFVILANTTLIVETTNKKQWPFLSSICPIHFSPTSQQFHLKTEIQIKRSRPFRIFDNEIRTRAELIQQFISCKKFWVIVLNLGYLLKNVV
jgi:hypothetical protein